MRLADLAPWMITAAALSFAAATWSPAPPPAPAPQVAAAAPQLTEAALRRVIRQEVAAQTDALLAAQAPSAETCAEPQADPRGEDSDRLRPAPSEAQRVALEDSVALVDDLIAFGHVNPDDVLELRSLLSQLNQADGELVLSAYMGAINAGQISTDGPPL